MKLDIASKYDGILAQFYDSDHRWRNYAQQVSLIAALFPDSETRKKTKVLDLCCGSGSHALEIARQGFRVTGADLSSVLLRIGRKKMRDAQLSVSFKKLDIFALKNKPEFRSGFDCVILLGWTLTLEHIFRRFNELLQGAAHILRPNGFFVFDLFTGRRGHLVSERPLIYRLPSGMRGKLKIEEEGPYSSATRHWVYRWNVVAGKKNGFARNFSVTARENLAILNRKNVRKVIEKYGKIFEVFKELSDYDLKSAPRPAGKNMVIILRKKEVKNV